ncbi:MAG: hypothetical protein WAO52_15095 [Prolixibacteraceae bacterium]
MRKNLRKNLFLFLLVPVLFYSCEEKTRYQSSLILRNQTDGKISVQLFPKAEFLLDDLYKTSSISNGYNVTTFEIAIGMDEDIFVSDDLQIQSWQLLAEVFDSIHIDTSGEKPKLLRFLPDKVNGYSQNMYSESDGWIFELRNFDMPTQLKQNPVESHDHIFVLSKDNY